VKTPAAEIAPPSQPQQPSPPSQQPPPQPQPREVQLNAPRDPAPEALQDNGADYDDDDAQTQVINGRPRHRRDLN